MSNNTILEFTQNLQDNRGALINYLQRHYSFLERYFEDIVQIAATTMWKKYDTDKHHRHFLPWAIAVLKNAARNFTRTTKRNRTEYWSSEELLDYADNLKKYGIGSVDIRLVCLLDIIETLPEKEQKLLEAVYVNGETITEFAAANNLAARTCFNKISELRKKLKNKINERVLLEMQEV